VSLFNMGKRKALADLGTIFRCETNRLNCTVTQIGVNGSGHITWEIRHIWSGHKRLFSTASSSKSNSGRLNAITMVRRIARELDAMPRHNRPR